MKLIQILTFSALSIILCESKGHAGTAPVGSYARSCKDISFKGYTLSATCKRKNQSENDTTLTLPCNKDIANCDGNLKCGEC